MDVEENKQNGDAQEIGPDMPPGFDDAEAPKMGDNKTGEFVDDKSKS